MCPEYITVPSRNLKVVVGSRWYTLTLGGSLLGGGNDYFFRESADAGGVESVHREFPFHFVLLNGFDAERAKAAGAATSILETRSLQIPIRRNVHRVP